MSGNSENSEIKKTQNTSSDIEPTSVSDNKNLSAKNNVPTPWYKQRKPQIGMAVAGAIIILTIAIGITFALNMPKASNDAQEETRADEQYSVSNEISSNRNDSNTNLNSDNTSTTQSTDSPTSNQKKNSYSESSSLGEDTKKSVSDSSHSLMPSLVVNSDTNKSWNIEDGDYIQVDDFWKYRNTGNNKTEFVRLADGYTFTVDANMGPNYTLDAHYKPDMEFATYDSEPVHFAIEVSNDFNESLWLIELKEKSIENSAGKDYGDFSYRNGNCTVMYSYSPKASTDNFYASNYIYVWDCDSQIFMTIYCDDYSGEEMAHVYTDKFHFQ